MDTYHIAVPSPVPGLGQFIQAPLGHSCQAPKGGHVGVIAARLKGDLFFPSFFALLLSPVFEGLRSTDPSLLLCLPKCPPPLVLDCASFSVASFQDPCELPRPCATHQARFLCWALALAPKRRAWGAQKPPELPDSVCSPEGTARRVSWRSSTCSILRISPRSLRVLKVEAVPRSPARPVRPTR